MLTDLPNVLTLSRIAAIPLLVLFAALRTPVGDMASCVVFGVAAITDFFDGRLARSRKQQSDLGRMLDPIADKLLVAATLILYPRYLDPVTRLPCGPELLVRRMADGQAGMITPLVRLRMAWGRVKKAIGR